LLHIIFISLIYIPVLGKISIVLEVCDVHKTCISVLTAPITVSLPETIADSVIQ